jgi:hypothetical protein
MTMTDPALIHSSDSENKVTNEIRDCPGTAIALVVKNVAFLNNSNMSFEKVILLY